jgi:hypothetical protein
MRVYLRMRTTGLYYGGAGQGSARLDGAVEFASLPEAARYAIAQQLSDAEIVLRCDCVDREVPLPVMPIWCDMDRSHGTSLRSPPPPAHLTLPPSVPP